MRKKTVKKLKKFIESYFPDKVGDKGFLRIVKRRHSGLGAA